MSIKRTLGKFSHFFQSSLVVLIATFFVVSIVYAATTIGSSITTEADLTVGGAIIASTWTGSITVSSYASTTGDLIVGGSTIDVTTSTATTTVGIFSRSQGSTGTTTVSIGDTDKNVVGCLEMVSIDDGGDATYYSCYVNTAGDGVVCTAGRCND